MKPVRREESGLKGVVVERVRGESFHSPLRTVKPESSLSDSPLAASALKALRRNSPLSMACTMAMLRPAPPSLNDALIQEFRWTWRAMDQGDFLEGVRAQIIDKDRNPKWRHASPAEVTAHDVAAMLAPLGDDDLSLT